MKAGHTSLTPLFVIVYLVAALVQVPYHVILYKFPGKNRGHGCFGTEHLGECLDMKGSSKRM